MEIIITPIAEKHLEHITDKRIQQGIEQAIESLETDPKTKGKPLVGPLAGYRSIRAASQKFRIIYKINDKLDTVTIVAIGRRKEGNKVDIYNLAKKLVKAGLLTLLLLLFQA
jgi:mRNA interferase RelE/StbE